MDHSRMRVVPKKDPSDKSPAERIAELQRLSQQLRKKHQRVCDEIESLKKEIDSQRSKSRAKEHRVRW
jgi:hypothetical protein